MSPHSNFPSTTLKSTSPQSNLLPYTSTAQSRDALSLLHNALSHHQQQLFNHQSRCRYQRLISLNLRTLQMTQIIHNQICRKSAALFEIWRKVVPAPMYFRSNPQPILYHWQQQMIDAVQTKGRSWHIEDIAKKMKKGFQSVRLITFWANHSSTCKSLNKKIPNSEYSTWLVHALQCHCLCLVNSRQNLVWNFWHNFLHVLRCRSVKSCEL